MKDEESHMEGVCETCKQLVSQNHAHPALKKISELKGSELYKCTYCYSYLHKQGRFWEIISANIPAHKATQTDSQAVPEQERFSSFKQINEKHIEDKYFEDKRFEKYRLRK